MLTSINTCGLLPRVRGDAAAAVAVAVLAAGTALGTATTGAHTGTAGVAGATA